MAPEPSTHRERDAHDPARPAGAIDLMVRSVLTCPACGHAEELAMPTDACLFFHECVACHARMRPREGDCCVFCSFGSVPCPPVQASGTSCCEARVDGAHSSAAAVTDD